MKPAHVKEGPMRCSDTLIQYTPDSVRTTEMYMPSKMKSSQMTYRQARRGLCAKSGGEVAVCRLCPAPCPMGSQCMRLEDDGRTEDPSEETNVQTIPERAEEATLSVFQRNFRDKLAHVGITQKAFAERLGVTQHTIVRWKHGNNIPRGKMLERLCEALGVSVDWMLGKDGAA